MKYTLLELAQTILSSMDSDEINSINDSVEAQQVVKIIQTVYYDIINRADLPEHFSLVSLDASTNPAKPVLMTIPSTVSEIKWLKYNNATLTDTDVRMELVSFVPLTEFLDRMDLLSESNDNIDSFTHSVGSDSYKFVYRTDSHPQTYTSFDDSTLIFDGYDSSVDSTLQKSKTRAYAKTVVPFTLSDTFTPNLDSEQFALLLNEAKSLAWVELKQSSHPKAEVFAKRGWSHLQNSKNSAGVLLEFDRLPHFGRK